MKKNNLYLILSVSLFLRIGYILIAPQEKVLTNDALEYDTIAVNLVKGNGFSIIPGTPTSVRPPLYPFFLGIIYLIFGHNYLIVRLIQAIISALTVLMLYLTGRMLFQEKIAKISAWILALYPVLIVYAGCILTETLFTFLLMSAIYFFVRGSKMQDNKSFVCGGILLGLAALTRPAIWLLPLLLLPWAVLTDIKNLKGSLFFAAMFLATIAPWSIRNFLHFNIIMPTSTGTGFGVFVTGYMAQGHTWEEGVNKFCDLSKEFSGRIYPKSEPRLELEKYAQNYGMEMIKNNKMRYFLIVLKRFPRFWWTSHSSVFGVDKSLSEYLREKNYLYLFVRFGLLGLHGIFLILAFIGIILSLKNWRTILILISILIYFTGHIAFDPCNRYHLPAIPYLFIFSAMGFVNLKRKLCNL